VKVVKELRELGVRVGVASPASRAGPRLRQLKRRQLYIGDVSYQVPPTRELRLRTGAPLLVYILLAVSVRFLRARASNTVRLAQVPFASPIEVEKVWRGFDQPSHNCIDLRVAVGANESGCSREEWFVSTQKRVV
jgi:hypothetical protein